MRHKTQEEIGGSPNEKHCKRLLERTFLRSVEEEQTSLQVEIE